MTYDQLVAFVAVAAEGTFTAASAALHKSQPAVSKLVRNLEDELGVQLFERAHFRTVRIIPVARRDHPLAAGGGPVPRTLLRAHAQIVLRDSAQGPDAPSLNVVEGVLRWSVTDVAAKKEVILAGMGWGGLPEHVVADALASGELVALEVPEFEVAMELFAMRRRDRAFGVVASALWEEIGRSGAAAL